MEQDDIRFFFEKLDEVIKELKEVNRNLSYIELDTRQINNRR